MAHNLVPADNFDTIITVPDNGDARTAGSVEVPLQAVTNRTEKLKEDLEFLATPTRTANDGILHIRKVADVTALKNLAGPTDGQVAWVDANKGLYQFVAASAVASDEPWVAVPTIGGGRWHLEKQGTINAANGVARLNSSARVPFAQLNNPITQIQSTGHPFEEADNSQVSIGSLAYVDIPGGLFEITLSSVLSTDFVQAQAYFHARLTGGSATAFVKLVIGGVDTALLKIRENDNLVRPYVLPEQRQVNVSGSVIVKLQARVTAGTLQFITGGSQLKAWAVRP